VFAGVAAVAAPFFAIALGVSILAANVSVCRAQLANPDDYRDGAMPPRTLAIGRWPTQGGTQNPSAPAPAITLDGDLQDWPASCATFLLGSNAQTGRRFDWTGTKDLSGAVRLAWDETYLYLAIDVADDKVLQAESAAEVWQGDTIELFFNTHPGQQRIDGFCQQAIVLPISPKSVLKATGPQGDFEGVEGAVKLHGTGAPEVVNQPIFNTKALTEEEKKKMPAEPKEFQGTVGSTAVPPLVVKPPTGYTMECRIPWKNLRGFTPASGSALGFQIYLDDRDGKGRKTQLMWYPSAITFSHPMHMNTLLLKPQGDSAEPRVLAGPATWCVTDMGKIGLSAVANVEGAVFATVRVTEKPDDLFTSGATITGDYSTTFPLEKAAERISTGQGFIQLPANALGQCDFDVTVYGDDGTGKPDPARVLARNTFQCVLGGTTYATLKMVTTQSKEKLSQLAKAEKQPAIDPTTLASLTAWHTRLNAFMGNEARKEALSFDFLCSLLNEYGDLLKALIDAGQGKDPYEGRTGSFVRAYRSPLTGEWRGYALYVSPEALKPKDQPGAPLIVLLHSIFADERQLSLLAKHFTDLGAIVYQGAAYRQFDWSGVSAAETWAGLDDVMQRYNIDKDRVYLTGYHIGGRGTWQLAMARPDLWAAVAPIFSGIDSRPDFPALDLYPQYFVNASQPQIPVLATKAPLAQPNASGPLDPLLRKMYEQQSLVTRLENLSTVPVLRTAYGEDDPDAAAERMAMYQRMKELGIPLRTHYVPGAMHGTPAEEFHNADFYRELLTYRRGNIKERRFSFKATTLREAESGFVRIDQFTSPDAVASVNDVGHLILEAGILNVLIETENASAISLYTDPRYSRGFRFLIDKDEVPAIINEKTEWHSYVRKPGPDGKPHWAPGKVADNEKRFGVSGPINDFQRDRFIFVYGTGGDTAEQEAQKKRGEKLSDWGLGAKFLCKADKDITEKDLQDSNVIVVGTPANNSLLAKMSDKIPLKYTDTSLQLGDVKAEGPGSGACLIVPNPLAPSRYAVILSAVDETGYSVWSERGPGGDYILGHAEAPQSPPAAPSAGATPAKVPKPKFAVTHRGWFSNSWAWTPELCVTIKPAPTPAGAAPQTAPPVEP
ncbi:MAG: sugar-binding protein, partial [Candidatus Methylacidiphilales bacterium]